MPVSILAATLLLLSTASSTAPEGETAPPDHIRYAVVDGDRTTIWVAYASGRTMYAQYDQRSHALTDRIDLRTPPEAFARLAASLAPFETARGLDCPGRARETLRDELSWGRDARTVALGLRPACGGREIGEAFGALIAASRVTGRSLGNDQWLDLSPEAAASVRTPAPTPPASGRMAFTPASAAVDAIAYRETGPRGAGGREWRIDRQGRGAFTSFGDPVANRTFSAGADGFEQIRGALSGMEDRQAACPHIGALHEPIGVWSWIRGDQTTSVRLEKSCMPPASEAADSIILGWTRGA